MIEGVDLSGSNPRTADWPAARRHGCRFAILKGAQGRNPKPKGWTWHSDPARAAGVLPGAYSFAIFAGPADRYSARVQVEVLARVAPPRLGDLRPTIDLETGGIRDRDAFPRAARQDWLHEAAGHVSRIWGCTPILYCGARFMADEFGADVREVTDRCQWWGVDYEGDGSGAPPIDEIDDPATRGPMAGRVPELVQWAGGLDLDGSGPWTAGRVPWISGEVDRNVVLGGEDVFRRLIQGA